MVWSTPYPSPTLDHGREATRRISREQPALDTAMMDRIKLASFVKRREDLDGYAHHSVGNVRLFMGCWRRLHARFRKKKFAPYQPKKLGQILELLIITDHSYLVEISSPEFQCRQMVAALSFQDSERVFSSRKRRNTTLMSYRQPP